MEIIRETMNTDNISRGGVHEHFQRVLQKAAGGGTHFLNAAGQFVNKVMEVDLVWSVVCTTNCLASGLTS